MAPILDIENTVSDISSHVREATEQFDEFYLNRAEFNPDIAQGIFEVTLNPYALAEAIRSAALDIDRWASFHLADQPRPQPDRHKFAGFVSKWIAHFRPLIALPIDKTTWPDISGRTLLAINAIYAFFIFRSYLDLGPRNNNDELGKLEEQLIYRFQFRGAETGENLAVLAYCYELIARLPNRDSTSNYPVVEFSPSPTDCA